VSNSGKEIKLSHQFESEKKCEQDRFASERWLNWGTEDCMLSYSLGTLWFHNSCSNSSLFNRSLRTALFTGRL
jgi:hypothetical protein